MVRYNRTIAVARQGKREPRKAKAPRPERKTETASPPRNAWCAERGINSTCLHPHNTTLRAQIAELQRASVIVSEDGSISYGSFFARNGVRHIMLGNDGVDSNVNSKRSATPEFMEGFALLFHGYMQMIYVMHKDFNRLFGEVLRTALDHAAVDLNLPPVGRGRGHDKVQAWV